MIRLEGGNPTVGDGFRIASKHLGAIFVFSFFSGTVGMVLRLLARRGKGLGRLGAAIGGLAWNKVAFPKAATPGYICSGQNDSLV